MKGKNLRLRGGYGAAARLAKGQHLRVTNLYGQQVVDTWAFNASDMSEFMSMPHTRSCLEKLIPAVGDSLFSNRRQPMLTVVEDTSPGVHDTLYAACDVERYHRLGHIGYHRNCADNFREALEEFSLQPPLPAPFNMFERVALEGQYPTGRLEIQPPLSRPGDFVLLRAEQDEMIVVLSACPQDFSLTNGVDRTPKDIEYQIF